MRGLLFIVLLAAAGFADSNLDNAIGWLGSVQNQTTGEINNYGVLGTAWGTIALSYYGTDENRLNKSLTYIASSQSDTDGGLPYSLGDPWGLGSSVDYTAPAIIAFISANKTLDSLKNNNKTAIDFLWDRYRISGGFDGWGYGEDVVSTSLAVIALSSSSENLTKKGKNPIEFIVSKQNPTDGGVDWYDTADATAEALIALNSAGINNQNTSAALYYLKSLQNPSTGAVVDPYITALSALAFHAYGWNPENELAVGYLKSVQAGNGRIGRVITQSKDSDASTTALAALAFMNFSFGNVSSSSRMDANLSCSFQAPFINETQLCTISVPQGWSQIYRYSIDGAVTYSDLPSASFSGFSPGSHLISASAFGTGLNLTRYTDIARFNFTAIGPTIESPLQNSAYNLGDTAEVLVSNATNLSVFFNGTRLNGITTNLTYSARIENLSVGNYSLYFSSPGFSEHRNFTVSDRYSIQITNPGGCTIGSASQIAFSVLGAGGSAVTNATVFACLNGNCAQTDGSIYQYTCAGSNSFYVNASRNGNFGSAQTDFSGTNPGSGGGGGSYVTVEVEFPPTSGKHDISRALNYGECDYAYDCFAKVANLDCGWFSAGGALACPGSSVSKTCLATGVDGIAASSKGWWSFYTNGALSAWGISCYKVNSGDRIKLKYAGDYTAESPPVPQPNSGTGLAAAPVTTQKNTGAKPAETPAPKPALIERAGLRMEVNIGKTLLSSARKNRATIVSGANAPCPTCDFASALLLKSGLDALNISTEVTTDDKTRECSTRETVVFIGGPAANRGVPETYRNITGSAEGAIYNLTGNCFVAAGNTRESTSRAVASLLETFK